MIYSGTKLLCKDNSGALIVKCIGIGKASKTWGSTSGQLITITVKTCAKGNRWVSKGSIQKGVIIWVTNTLHWFSKSAEDVWFFENSIVLMAKKINFQPIGTRVFGPVSWEVWNSTFMKVVLLSNGVF